MRTSTIAGVLTIALVLRVDAGAGRARVEGGGRRFAHPTEGPRRGRGRASAAHDEEHAALRGHTENINQHSMFVCANPGQREVGGEQGGQKCRKLWPPDVNMTLADSWAGGNQLRCMGVPEQPECIKQGTICINGETEAIPQPCHFPFEYQGVLHHQCYKEPGKNETPFCFEAPNFKTHPCSPAASMYGCVSDAVTRAAFDPNKVKLPCKCQEKGFWNAPPSGGSVLTIVGSGFGSWEKECSTEYMNCLQAILDSGDAAAKFSMDVDCIRQTYGANSEYLPQVAVKFTLCFLSVVVMRDILCPSSNWTECAC